NESEPGTCSSNPQGIDLVVTSDDIMAFPRLAGVGDAVRLAVVIRNPGDGSLVLGDEGVGPIINVATDVHVRVSVDDIELDAPPAIEAIPQAHVAVLIVDWI